MKFKWIDPQGLNAKPDECLKLNKTIYGLVQSACQFFKKLIKCLKDLGFMGGEVDPCLMVKKTKNEIAYVAIYVDDCLFFGSKDLIKKTVEDIKKWGLQVKEEDDLKDYLSCNIVFDKNREQAWLGQPHLIKNLDQKFGEMVKHLQTYRTLGTPNQGVTRPKKNEPKEIVDAETQAMYRSGIGMLLLQYASVKVKTIVKTFD